MQRQMKLYASVTDSRGMTLPPMEITDKSEAFGLALENNGIFFRTFEIPTSMICGKRLEGEPENFSEITMVAIPAGARWIGASAAA